MDPLTAERIGNAVVLIGCMISFYLCVAIMHYFDCKKWKEENRNRFHRF